MPPLCFLGEATRCCRVVAGPGLLDNVPGGLLRRQGDRQPRKQERWGGIQHRQRRRSTRPCCHQYASTMLAPWGTRWRSCVWKQESVMNIVSHASLLTQRLGFKEISQTHWCKYKVSQMFAWIGINSWTTRGCGICVFIKDAWCMNYMIKDTVYTLDLTLICLSLWPFYLPRDYGNIFICAVYIPPSKAASRVADCVYQQIQNKPDAPIFVLGDFNHCKMDYALVGSNNMWIIAQGKIRYWINAMVI